MNMKKLSFLLVLILGVSLIAGCSSPNKITGDALNNNNGNQITVFKSQSCGCCSGYITGLDRSGFSVDEKVVNDVNPIKDKYNIPQNMRSCHTTIVGDYFVEGHVPIEAINKLLEEQPDIDGIALPGMPSGTPGMPGSKTETWVIYSLSDGKSTEFMKI